MKEEKSAHKKNRDRERQLPSPLTNILCLRQNFHSLCIAIETLERDYFLVCMSPSCWNFPIFCCLENADCR